MRLRIHRSAHLRICANRTQTTHHKQEEKVLHFWSPVPEHLPDQCWPVAGRVWPVLTESKLNTKSARLNLSLSPRQLSDSAIVCRIVEVPPQRGCPIACPELVEGVRRLCETWERRGRGGHHKWGCPTSRRFCEKWEFTHSDVRKLSAPCHPPNRPALKLLAEIFYHGIQSG